MQPLPLLPPPDEAALRHSRVLAELIHGEIAAADGWISFEQYMKLALYAPSWVLQWRLSSLARKAILLPRRNYFRYWPGCGTTGSAGA